MSATRGKKRLAAAKPAPRKKPGAARRKAGTKVARPAKAPAVGEPGAAGTTPAMAEFMAQAVVMELEAAQRYEEFADAMETHNNRPVAAMFRKLAGIEARHADELMSEMGWSEVPLVARIAFEGFEGAETAPHDDVHYLMQPWHVLELALANEQRAERLFAYIARIATDDGVRSAAETMREEEREHVALVRAWMRQVERPAEGWAHDPDPPRHDS